MQSVTIENAEGHLGDILDRLAPGEEVVLTRDEQPIATLRAIPLKRKAPQFGTMRGTVFYVAPDFDAIPEGFEDYLP